jgi:hypothetical protein
MRSLKSQFLTEWPGRVAAAGFTEGIEVKQPFRVSSGGSATRGLLLAGSCRMTFRLPVKTISLPTKRVIVS